MPDLINIPDCGGIASTFNSGIPLCDVLLGKPIGIIGLDPGVGWNAAQRATKADFLSRLSTLTHAARGGRAYPFYRLSNYEPKFKEPTRSSTGNLTNAEVVTAEAVPGFSFEHNVGVLMHQKLQQAENAGLVWGIVDDKYRFVGTNSNGILTGYSLSEFYTNLIEFASTSAPSKYKFDLTLASLAEYKENFAFFQADKTILSYTGLRDVTLAASIAVSTLSVELTAIGGTNIATLFATELAQAGAWEVKKVSDGSTVTVSAAYNATTKKMDLSLSGTPWTGASTGNQFTVNLVAPASLKALTSPMVGYESTGAATFAKP